MTPNGCGPKWMPNCLRPRFFDTECDVHDIDYMSGLDRKTADKVFLYSMLRRSRTSMFPPYRRAQAYTFYILVRLFGRFYYDTRH